MYTKLIFSAAIFWIIPEFICFDINLGNIDFKYNLTTSGIKFEVINDKKQVLTGSLLNSVDTTKVKCEGLLSCDFGNFKLNVTKTEDGLHVLWESEDLKVGFTDCFDFGTSHWYGGPQRGTQRWPIERLQVNGSEPYTINADFPVAERYWLNSKGAYIFVEDKVPLFVEQNVHIHDAVCFNARLDGPYIRRTRNVLEYDLVFKDDPKQAHLHAVNNHLGKPKSRPSAIMVKEPIWSTWARYKGKINDDVVLKFGKEIRQHGYKNGQLEIDAGWESCYGSKEFDKHNFGKIKDVVKQLKEQDYRVTLWTTSFVSPDCQNNSRDGVAKGYFVVDEKGNTIGSAASGGHQQIDTTKPEAAKWYLDSLKALQTNIGIDGFKCDAGETYYAPQPAVYENVEQERVPNILSESFVRLCATIGDLIEVKVAYRSQDLPIFIRMRDKHSTWGDNTGLYTVITTLLQLNMNGYGLVLPDYIGGNGYRGVLPDAELLVRWTQANTFMPTMQFSYLPWDYTSEDFNAEKIISNFIELHANISTRIMEAIDGSISNGTPVNAPIWWVDPTDEKALACDDEFLLGEDLLIAPVIKDKARSRDVYLPKGKWQDGNNGNTYQGPVLLEKYDAPIELLPYFYKLN